MPTLNHRLGSQNQTTVAHRMERARQVMFRLPLEVAGSVLQLRRQRVALDKLFVEASRSGNAAEACRLSDALVKVVAEIHRMSRSENANRPRKGQTHEMQEAILVDATELVSIEEASHS